MENVLRSASGVIGNSQATLNELAAFAEERGVPRAQVALAWVAANPVVTAPIVGATKEHHISDAVAAVDLVLSDDERERLEAAYQPHAPAGF